MATTLVLANRLFRDQKYSAAIYLYKQAQREWPRLHEIIDFNLKFTERQVNIKKHNGDSKYKYNYELNDSCPTSDQYDYFINEYEVLQTHQVAKDQINPQKWLSLGQDPYFVINPKEIFLIQRVGINYQFISLQHSRKERPNYIWIWEQVLMKEIQYLFYFKQMN